MVNLSKKCLILLCCLVLTNACSGGKGGPGGKIDDLNQLIQNNNVLENASLKEIKDTATGSGQNLQGKNSASSGDNSSVLEPKIAKRAQELIEATIEQFS